MQGVHGLLVVGMIAGAVASAGAVQALELPPEITPAIRQACEGDVRRLCVRPDSTMFSVRVCVLRKVASLNDTCRKRLADAGLIEPPKIRAARN